MNRSQRNIAIVYGLLIACCCTWVPWHLVVSGDPAVRLGYGWIWAGPHIPSPPNYDELAKQYGGTPVASPQAPTPQEDDRIHLATPDLTIVGMTLFAVTVLAGVALLIGMRRREIP